MPYVQKLYDNYTSKGVVVLTVNYNSDEKDLAPGFLKAHHYTFPALQATDAWLQTMKQTMKIGMNWIVDRDGRGVYKPDPIDKESMETAETELDLLLDSGHKQEHRQGTQINPDKR